MLIGSFSIENSVDLSKIFFLLTQLTFRSHSQVLLVTSSTQKLFLKIAKKSNKKLWNFDYRHEFIYIFELNLHNLHFLCLAKKFLTLNKSLNRYVVGRHSSTISSIFKKSLTVILKSLDCYSACLFTDLFVPHKVVTFLDLWVNYTVRVFGWSNFKLMLIQHILHLINVKNCEQTSFAFYRSHVTFWVTVWNR